MDYTNTKHEKKMWHHEQQEQQMVRQFCQPRKLTLEDAKPLSPHHPEESGNNCRGQN